MKIKITEPQYNILVKDKSTIDDLSSKFPQWDFTNATIRREKNPKGQTYRFLDGLYCNKHKTTNDNINVSDLLKRGSGCRECGREKQIESGMSRKPLEQWVLDLDKVGFETKIENFKYMKNSSGKNALYVKDAVCKKCGEKINKYLSAWEMNSGKISCPKCSIGKWRGEETIKEILDEMGVEYITKYKFSDLKGKEHNRTTKTGFSKNVSLPYYFDFYLPESNTIIEYDGELHFFSKERYGGEEHLNNYIYRDTRKNDYLLDKGIKLIRVPYTTKDKEEMKQEIVAALESNDKRILTGNYPNLGWNSPNL
jgi:very-short-patch-repair endonuclease/predicted Zn-ribbon and HTH transcriptional regulator